VTSREALLSGDRSAVALVLIGGRPLYGERALMLPLQPKAATVVVDGVERCLEPELGRRAAGILKRHSALRHVPWLADVRFGEGDGTRPSRGDR
jgi:hypothetical protein